ncbi:MAG: nuclear transport factor 2 family protein [Brevundimonas sp.]|uniref:nuclear transport factor 2 family protein n=1 Tax=Brevundimonas sp. TaxID=1871086 RepID=UPI000DB248B3|nr:nuclear transport factor 2 family protein [Brevundimonas sp.]PZU00415.1 MAG: nuclear transport factor 2 family protein [Brevundimonas sp.]
MSIEARIAKLEAESDIRRLKARYWNACDAKDVAAIRACFTEDAELDYPPLGQFGLDGLIEIFTSIAVGTPVVDVHQGHNAEIRVIDGDNAEGVWNLGFSTFNPAVGAYRTIAGIYHDRYVRTADGWRIAYSRHQPRSVVDGQMGAEGMTGAWSPG